MFTPKITVSQWLSIKMQTRVHLAEVLKLHKTAFTVVENGVVKSDGYHQHDLDEITVEKLQALTGSTETDLFKLFEGAIKAHETPPEPMFQLLDEKTFAQFVAEYEKRSGKKAPEIGVGQVGEEFKHVDNKPKNEKTNQEAIKEVAAVSPTKEQGTNHSGNETTGGSKKTKSGRKGKAVPPTA